MPYQSKLLEYLLESWPIEQWQAARVVVAVSGGADSVALLRALHALAPDRGLLHVAHYNHGWRAVESDDDERFVIALCRTLGLSYTTGRHTAADEVTRSEQVARKLRYRFLREVARENASKFIVTAHSGSDRVETMLHNLCRGTGLAGVCTPVVSRSLDSSTMLVRPLIGCFRDQIIEYLSEIGQGFRQDSSNENQAFRRNFLRHSVLPLLRQAYGKSVDQHLLSYSQLAEQALQVQLGMARTYWLALQALEIEHVFQGWLPNQSGDEIRLPSRDLLPAEWPIVRLALQQAWESLDWKQQFLTRKHWQRLLQAWETLKVPVKLRPRKPRSVFQLPSGIRVSSMQGWLILSRCTTVR